MSNLAKVNNYFKNNMERIQDACSKSSVKEQLMDCVQVMVKNPKLQQCTELSIIGSIITASRLGVSLDPNIKHAYLIPYGKEAKLDISYMGLIDVVYRSTGSIIEAHMVYSNDKFEYRQGSNPVLNHEPAIFNKGDELGVYAICRFPNGEFSCEFMDVAEINKCKSKSKGGNVWDDWREEMAKKSVIRRLFKRIPKSKLDSEVLAFDEKQEIGESTKDYYEIDGVDLPEEQVVQSALDKIN